MNDEQEREWCVRGSMSVDVYVTVRATSEEDAINKGDARFDEAMQDDLDMGDIHMEFPEIDVTGAK